MDGRGRLPRNGFRRQGCAGDGRGSRGSGGRRDGHLRAVVDCLDPSPFPLSSRSFAGWKQAASCAVAFAHQNAADYGGDAARTVVYGLSAGAGVGMLATLQPSTDPVAGCQADAVPLPITGAVLGDGEYFLHSDNFNDTFKAEPARMAAEMAGLTEPKKWPADLSTRFFLWVADDGTAPRRIDDPADQGWFDQRDPDGSIRADLERLGRLEDGRVTIIDAGELMKLATLRGWPRCDAGQLPGRPHHQRQDSRTRGLSRRLPARRSASRRHCERRRAHSRRDRQCMVRVCAVLRRCASFRPDRATSF